MIGGDALLELLEQEGIRMLFGNPGSTELPLLDALAADPTMRYVLGLQEALLSLPQDVRIESDEIDLQEPTRVAARVRGDAVAIAAAGALLSAAQRPVIVVGDAVGQSRAHADTTMDEASRI
jgi:benzoylformate decarboxylase